MRNLPVSRFIAALAVAAGLALAATALWGRGSADGSLLLVLAAGFGLTLAFPLRNPLTREVAGLELQEAVLLPALVLLPAWPATPLFCVAAIVAMVARRRGLQKGVFNVAQWVLAVSLAFGIEGLLGPSGGDLTSQVGPAVIAVAAASLLNFLTVGTVVSLATGTSIRSVWEHHLAPSMIVWAGNVALGVLLLVVAEHEPGFLPIVLVPALMTQLSYRAMAERSAEGRRLARLGRAELALAAATDAPTLGAELADHAYELLTARAAIVTIQSAGEPVVRAAGDPSDPERPVRGPGELEEFVRLDEATSVGVRMLARRNLDPYTDEDQQILASLVHRAADVLARMSLFEVVRREQQKLQDVVSSSSDGIFSVNAEQRIESWNPAMQEITGRPPAEVVGRPCYAAFDARSDEGSELCPHTCPGRCGFHGEPVPVQVTAVSGESRWLHCTYSPLPEGGYVVVARDITAQKEVEDMKADFLATVSHELRTPLTPIKGFLSTLRQRDLEMGSDQRAEMYDIMHRQTERLERLVCDLLEATSLERQPHLYLLEEIDWAATVANVMELSRRQEPERHFELSVLGDVEAVLADEQRAEQILTNLLSNAVKYSPPGMPIDVIVEQRGTDVVTTVVDRGPGVQPVQRERIFERFTRLGDYRTRTSGGAGLGLYIAKRFVEGMGGHISVDRGPDGGAAFSFTLPARERAAR